MEDTQVVSSAENQVQNPQMAAGSFWWYLSNDGAILKMGEEGGEGVYMLRKWSDEWSVTGSFKKSRFNIDFVFLGHTEEEASAAVEHSKHLLESGEGLEMIASFQEPEEPGMELMRQQDKLVALEKRALQIIEKSNAVRAQMKMAMQAKRAEMDRIMSLAKSEIDKAFAMVAKVQKIIRSLELYAGVNEDLVQITEGAPAPENAQLIIRQAVIFMDEEVGDWREGGFDYSNVEDFDEWLKNPINLYRVAPEQKCLVAFRPRRHAKEYQETRVSDKNRWNKETYFLIRNGENLYRIFTENLQLGTRVFLSPKDLQETADKGLQDDEKDMFTRQALFIQGLIDRGEVFNPVPPGINIFQPETYQNWLHLIYDMDGVLQDGRLPWKEWKEGVNAELQEGSRVIIAEGWLGQVYSWRTEDQYIMNKRTKRYYSNIYNMPKMPGEGGMFIAEKGFSKGGNKEEWDLSFRYSPGGEYWSWSGYSERKNKVAFGFDRDEMVLNYDFISLDDVEYYLNDRVQRANYLSMLPLLEKIRKERLKEIEQQKDFVKLIAGQNGVSEDRVWPLIHWWCTKNKWKRPVTKDDTLALRMINRKIASLKKRGGNYKY